MLHTPKRKQKVSEKQSNQDAHMQNVRYYDSAYKSRVALKAILKLFFSYDQLSKSRRNLRLAADFIDSMQEGRVLDYGFGHGAFLLRLPRELKLHGCELSKEAIANISKLCSFVRRPIDLISARRFAVSSDFSEIDLICCSHVLEHVENDSELLQIFYDKLKNDGVLLLNVPINEVHVDERHVRSYTRESTHMVVERVGFKVVRAVEQDRWTAFILHNENVSRGTGKLMLRALRLFLAVIPVSLLDRWERILPAKYENQQLLLLARKHSL